MIRLPWPGLERLEDAAQQSRSIHAGGVERYFAIRPLDALVPVGRLDEALDHLRSRHVSGIFIRQADPLAPGSPTFVAKGCMDVAGWVTTNGSAALAATRSPAQHDAWCVAQLRAAGWHLLGTTTQDELCFGATGMNPWYGTPDNPADPGRIPGGSSGGSAVAVARGMADVGLGTDTTGSIRTPAACCGVIGLKTTHGRFSLDGVDALARSLDSLGVLARDLPMIDRVLDALDPKDPRAARPKHLRVGRLRGPASTPEIDAAVDQALSWNPDVDVADLTLTGWDSAADAGRTVLFGEAWREWGEFFAERGDEIGSPLCARFELARAISDSDLDAARQVGRAWRHELAVALDQFDVLALPALEQRPPLLNDPGSTPNRAAIPASLAGVPAIVLPVPTNHDRTTGLQLVGRHGSERGLVAAAGLLGRPAG